METAAVDKPVHKHDCAECQWVASFRHPWSKTAEPCDVYLCEGETGAQLKVRYHKGQGNLLTHPVTRPSLIPEVVAGVRLARENGMLA